MQEVAHKSVATNLPKIEKHLAEMALSLKTIVSMLQMDISRDLPEEQVTAPQSVQELITWLQRHPRLGMECPWYEEMHGTQLQVSSFDDQGIDCLYRAIKQGFGPEPMDFGHRIPLTDTAVITFEQDRFTVTMCGLGISYRYMG